MRALVFNNIAVIRRLICGRWGKLNTYKQLLSASSPEIQPCKIVPNEGTLMDYFNYEQLCTRTVGLGVTQRVHNVNAADIVATPNCAPRIELGGQNFDQSKAHP